VDADNAARISEDDFRSLERNGCRPHIGDVLFSKDGTVGKAALVERDDIVVLSSLAILQPGPYLLSSFLYQFLCSAPGVLQIESKFAGAALRRITLDVIVDLVASIPPMAEQCAIVGFLDRETVKIDALIKMKERLIELLQEKRIALISHAVTKGLDPNVPMKDSGVEWLGKIPDNWQNLSLRRKVFLREDGIKIGTFGSQLKLENMKELGYKVYGQENVISSNFEIGSRFVSEEKFRELSSCEIKSGDILITMMGSAGRAAIVPQGILPGLMDSHLIRIRLPETELDPNFVAKIIDQADYLKAQLITAGKGAIMHGLNSEIIKDLKIVYPEIQEQRKILQFIDFETSKINLLLRKSHESVEKLKEYRTALISAAVIGKIDIREEVE
jgi:type I restriction enzyme S subunit